MNTQRSIGGSAESQSDVDAEREPLKRARPGHGWQGRTGGEVGQVRAAVLEVRASDQVRR